MASRNSSLFAFLLLAVTVAVGVAARPNAHLRVHTEESFVLVDVLRGSNEVIEFQIGVQVQGRVQYLYSEGARVLSTPSPDSVGTARTFWRVSEAPSDGSDLSSLSFAISDKDTRARLFYNSENTTFYGAWEDKLSYSNWRLWRSVDQSHRYKLQYIRGTSPGEFAQWAAGDEPQIFLIDADFPLPYTPVRVEVGTEFQLKNQQGLYLYSEGEKVLTTPVPDFVGTRRTIWRSVKSTSSDSQEYADAFAIRNSDTGYVLLYNGNFYGKTLGGSDLPSADWKLFVSTERPTEYRLTYLPISNGFIDGTFTYVPIAQSSSRRFTI